MKRFYWLIAAIFVVAWLATVIVAHRHSTAPLGFVLKATASPTPTGPYVVQNSGAIVVGLGDTAKCNPMTVQGGTGHALVVALKDCSNVAASVTDTLGNKFVPVSAVQTATDGSEEWFVSFDPIAGPDTVSVNINQAGHCFSSCEAIETADTTSVAAANGTAYQSAAELQSGTVAAANSLLLSYGIAEPIPTAIGSPAPITVNGGGSTFWNLTPQALATGSTTASGGEADYVDEAEVGAASIPQGIERALNPAQNESGSIIALVGPSPTPTPTASPIVLSPAPTSSPTATPSASPTLSPSPSPTPSGQKFVFAHYHMPYCVGDTTGCASTALALQAAYTNDIANALALGINGFALNAGDWISVENRYPPLVAAMYAAADAYNAAHGANFKLFVSPDLSGGAADWAQSDFVNLLNTYCSNAAQFTYDGKCVLSGWNIDTGYTGAQMRSMFAASNVGAAGVYFVPGFNGQGTNNALSAAWLPYIDGVFAFDCCATNSIDSTGGPGLAITQAASFASAIRAAGKGYNGLPLIYLAGTTSHFWETASSYDWYMETQGFQGLENYWNQIITTTHPDWVEAFTWSDIGESWESPLTGLANGSPQGAGTALQAYYVQWFKTGAQPPITTDQLYYSYRVNPAAMACTGHVEGSVAGGVPVLDDIYVTTLLSPGSAGTLTVTSGAATHSYPISPGITNTAIPFTVSPTQTFTLTRAGSTEISLTGPPITNAGGPCNFDPVTGVGYSNGYQYPPYALGALAPAPQTSPTATATPSPTPSATATPSPSPSPTTSPSPTSTPSPTATASPSPTPVSGTPTVVNCGTGPGQPIGEISAFRFTAGGSGAALSSCGVMFPTPVTTWPICHADDQDAYQTIIAAPAPAGNGPYTGLTLTVANDMSGHLIQVTCEPWLALLRKGLGH